MKVHALAFANGDRIPVEFTEDGQNSSPALRWEGVPDGTRSLALVVDDPDAPRPEPWVHWLAWNIPPGENGLPEGMPRVPEVPAPAGVVQGATSWGRSEVGYRGPAPPRGHGEHHYRFRLYALDTELVLPPGAGRHDLEKAMQGHVIESAEHEGIYSR